MGKVQEALARVQKALNVPKNNYNSFGRYSYRSAENIVEAAKPLCVDNGLLLTLSDTIVDIGGRVYVKAEAAVTDVETGDKIEVTAYAREPETKKGMDDSQITGTASSYARKYAMGGLFALDDSKDADTEEYTRMTTGASAKCSCCGNTVVAKAGMTAESIIDKSKLKFNKILCYECSVAQNKAGGVKNV